MNQTFRQHPKLLWLLFLFLYSWRATVAVAQISPDRTLPNNSTISSDGNIFTVNGGTTAGANLFHSFSEFSLPTGTEAFFNNPVNIDTIFTRVTGSNLSNIDGLIRANGAANLFLINPNGIRFGNNARLAIGGSFFGSTANSLLFPDGLEFNANVGNQTQLPLLSVNVPIGLQMGQNSGTIQVQNTGITDIFPTDNFGLAVAPGQTLALVGNQINVNGGIVTAPSGRIELGSVASGEVGIVPTPVGFQLNYDSVDRFGNIQLSNRSSLFSPAVFDNPLSEINLTGNNIGLNGSQIVSLTDNNAKSGTITLNAAESLQLGGAIATFPFSAWIVNQVAPEATGTSGNIQVTAPQISISNGARIQTISLGQGRAGHVNVDASESIEIAGFALPPNLNLDPSAIDPETLLEQNTNSRIASENFASGAGGDVSISAGEINFLAGGQIATLAGFRARANGGKIDVTAETITAEGAVLFNPLVPSGIASYTLGEGQGGAIDVSAEKLNVFDGAFVVSWTQGNGRSGDIMVNATDSITGRGVNPGFPFADSGISSIAIGSGNGGNIEVSTGKISLFEGAQISSRTLIELAGIAVPNGGTGNAGDVTIDADTIELTGTSPLAPDNPTIVGSLTFGSGNAGDISISTRQLRVFEGAQLLNLGLFSISALGEPLPGSGTGNSGNLTLNAAELIEVSGVNPLIPSSSSGIGVSSFGFGGSGDLIVNTPRLILQDGAGLATGVNGAGDAGRVTVNASNILISGTSPGGDPSFINANAFGANEDIQQAFFASPIPTGNTGELTVNASRITITNGGQMGVEHQGIGNAGRLQINVERLNLDNGGRIDATTAFGFGGNVEINVAESLQLRNGAQINVEALGNIGDGGNLTINADTIVALENSDIIANAVGGNGGNINITTQGIFGTEFRPNLTPMSDITASSQLGVDGIVEINNPDVDPTAGLLALSSALAEPSDQILSSCAADEGNEFYIIGRGGIPPHPFEPIARRAIWQDLRGSRRSARNPVSQPDSVSSDIVEATGWVVDADGSIQLVARATEFNAQAPGWRSRDCTVPKQDF